MQTKGNSCCDITMLNSCYGYRTLCSIDKIAATTTTDWVVWFTESLYWCWSRFDDDDGDGLTHRCGTTTVHVVFDKISGQFIVCVRSTNVCVMNDDRTVFHSEDRTEWKKYCLTKNKMRQEYSSNSFNWRNCKIVCSRNKKRNFIFCVILSKICSCNLLKSCIVCRNTAFAKCYPSEFFLSSAWNLVRFCVIFGNFSEFDSFKTIPKPKTLMEHLNLMTL